MKRFHDDPVIDALMGALAPYNVLLQRAQPAPLAPDDDTPEPAPANEPRPLRQDEE